MPLPDRVIASFVLGLLASCGACESGGESGQSHRPTPNPVSPSPPGEPKSAEPAPKHLYLGEPSAARVDLSTSGFVADGMTYGPPPPEAAPSVGRGVCPGDMVSISDEYCIDRYEVTLVDASQGRALSPHYPADKRLTTMVFSLWTEQAARSRRSLGRSLGLPEVPKFTMSEDFSPRARSLPDTIPAGYLRRSDAETACENAGKRLCSREEWVRACRGERNTRFPYGDTYHERACNVHRAHHPAALLHGDSSRYHNDPRLGLAADDDGPLLRPTGATPTCVSRWGEDGVYDMVGNLDEWIAEPEGSFLGGFFSRGTKEGCLSSIDSHSPSYWDYSLGTRCCADAYH